MTVYEFDSDDSFPIQIGGIETRAIRDTGADVICVRSDLIPEGSYTGRNVSLVTARRSDGTREVRWARVFIDSPYFVGSADVVAVPDLTFPVLLGNRTSLADGSRVKIPVLPSRCCTVQASVVKESPADDPKGLPLKAAESRSFVKLRWLTKA